MKAVIYHGKGRISLENIPVPEINDNEILIKVYSALICGTDLKIINNGHFKIREGESKILGHEVGGEVVKIGKNVTGFKIGDNVSMAPNVGCGKCRECISGNTQLCKDYEAIGITFNGAFAEYMKVPQQFIEQGNIYVFPQNISYEEGSLAEILASVLSGAEACRIGYSDIVLIVGAGPIGIVHTMLVKISGAQRVIVSEIKEDRRKQALKFKADVVINPDDSDYRKRLLEETYGRGPDVIIIASPSPKAQEESVEIAARGGRINFFGGLTKDKDLISIKSNFIHYNYITVTGTTGSNVLQYRKAMELIISKRIPITKIISKRYKLEEYKAAFEAASSGKNLKILFTPSLR